MGTFNELKLTYNLNLLRVRLSIPCGLCRQTPTVPPDLKIRMHKKMQAEVAKGNCSHYISYWPRLESLWERIKNPKFAHFPDSFEVKVTLAAGIPSKIPGVSVIAGENASDPPKFTAKKVNTIEKLHPKVFIAYLKHLLNAQNITYNPCPAQLMSFYQRLLCGEEISSQALEKAVSIEERASYGDAPYTILTDAKNRELKLLIFDIQAFEKGQGLSSLFAALEAKLAPLNSQIKGKQASIWKSWIMEEIDFALTGVERFGMLLPLTILAASPNFQEQDKTNNMLFSKEALATARPTSSSEQEYPGKGILQLQVASDHSTATIQQFNVAYFEQEGIQLNQDWLHKEIKRLGLHSLHDTNLKRVVENLAKKRDINGIMLAQAVAGEAAKDPQIVLKKPLGASKQQSAVASDHIDLRKRNLSDMFFAKKDEHIAELIYQEAAKEGQDIFGRPLPPPPTSPPALKLGEGVSFNGATSFYAKHDGIIKADGLSISNTLALVHHGDVNLSSGDLDFAGPIAVEGSIDTGATVTTPKDLQVQGTIRQSHVFVGGNLEVKGGIITGEHGKILCQGQVSAEFIENSVIFCHGDIVVRKAIIASKIYCSGKVIVEKAGGVIAGSEIYVAEAMLTHDLGFKEGRNTRVFLGCNWQQEYSLQIKQSRWQKLALVYENNKKEFASILHKDKRQISKKLAERKEQLRSFNLRLKEILLKLENKVTHLKNNLTFYQDSYIKIKGTLFPSCKIYAKGKEILFPSSLQAVVILAQAIKDSQVMSLDDFDRRQTRKES